MLKLVAAIVATLRHGRLKLVRAVVREPPARRLCQGFQTPFDPSIHCVWTPSTHWTPAGARPGGHLHRPFDATKLAVGRVAPRPPHAAYHAIRTPIMPRIFDALPENDLCFKRY